MSRYYPRRHRKYAPGTHRRAFFIIVGSLLLYKLWIDRTGLLRYEHIAVTLVLMTLFIVVIAFTFRVSSKIKKRMRLNNPNMTIVDNMTGLEFEKYVAKLLGSQGYKHVRLTERFDLGVDIIADKNGTRWGIQVKRHSGLVKAIAVRQVVTALRKYKCDRALVITNSIFSNVAKELASTNDCVLVDRTQLSKWVASYKHRALERENV